MNQEKAIEKIISVVKVVLGEDGRELTGDTKVESIGVSSIDYVKTLIMLETEFEIEFDDDDLVLDEDTCIADLAYKVCAKLA